MNRLANETSPYLLQHAGNPVDWYPWGPEALERARSEDKPILLSVGYAACHWCHVMERESFEHEGTAQVMNELFVSIKVDREERPDLDSIYMQAVQAMTGQGGWPMTVFLTPEGAPFYGGTYYPPDDRQGMPSFVRVLRAVADAYHNRRDGVDATAAQLRQVYDAVSEIARSTGSVTVTTLDLAYRALAQSFDGRYAGFGAAPKFPPSMSLEFLLTHGARTGVAHAHDMVVRTFRAMSRGGMYDQIGGGFHRYSVDARWLVPHFEKMLYDNALLARLGVHLWQVTGDPEVRRVTEQTLDWVMREMTSSSGGFYSSLDADSEGHEGKFYVWSDAELREVVGQDAEIAATYWGIAPAGNFEGANIPNVRGDPAGVARRVDLSPEALQVVIERARAALYAVRARRVWPARDDKVLAGWNALMLRAFAEAARAFARDDYRQVALHNAEFLRREMTRDGRVMRSHKDGVTRGSGFLDDQAAMALALLEVYALTFDRRWFDDARVLADAMNRWFWDEERQAFFDTASDHEVLITRPRDVTDNAVPAGTSLAAELLLRLGEITGESAYGDRGRWVVETLAETLTKYPSAFGHLLSAVDLVVHGGTQLVLVGDPSSADFGALVSAAGRIFVPSSVVAGGVPDAQGGLALLEHRSLVNGKAAAYVCRHYTCEAPVTTAEDLEAQLRRAIVPVSSS